MPRSRSSARSCTATNSSQPSSSQSSTQLSYKRSAAGSFSTIKSDPFLHADALDATDPDALDPDSTIQWMPSYYFHDWPQHLSPTHSPRRNALTPSTPTSASQYSSKVSLLPQGLMYLIRSSNLRSQTQQMLLAMVRMIVYISHKLFPTSHVLREDVSRDIKQISQDMCEFLDLVLEKLDQRIVTANAAVDKLSEYQGEDNLPLEEAMQWVEMISGLHKPNHVETKIFRRMVTLFEEYVYLPFLQLHRQEPEHNMYALDPFLEQISIRLRTATTETASADRLVRHIEHNMDMAMTHVNVESKRHVPSRSVPAIEIPRLLQLRQRENTL